MILVLRRLWIQITSDRKQFGILCAMLAVGLLLWARIIVTSNLPRTAVADDPKSPARRGLQPRGGVWGTSDKHQRPPVRVELSRLPRRDPFLISAQHFPKPTPVDMLTQDQAKLQRDTTENPEQAEARLIDQLRALIERFELEAVMQGRPMAVINGRTYRLLDWIPAIDNSEIRFQLVEVGHRSVVLEFEGRPFELEMKHPGSVQR
ncbi:MAG: hypothetical protein O6768_06565 [Planctomycetota bacterium]|nr:hypothetical protein [Planctomycetota bacterium]